MAKLDTRLNLACACLLVGTGAGLIPLQAQTLEPPFDADYTVIELGEVPGLPSPNGGLIFKAGDPDTLLIGGDANEESGDLYQIALIRDAQDRIVSFDGVATVFAEADANDGGIAYGPGGVMFLARWPNNELGQMMPGSTTTDKVIDLAPLGVAESPGGLNFVPHNFPGAGSFKLASWNDGGWYTLTLSPDGNGTFDVMSANLEAFIPGGPEGFVYISPGSPQFTDYTSVLVTDWTEDSISVYTIDGNGDPIPSTRTLFMTNVNGPEGAAIDPLTGDLLFSFFTPFSEQVLVVRGFAPPEPEDEDEEPAECIDPQPGGKGHWHHQCMAVPADQGGLRSGNRGPKKTTEPGFVEELMPCADAMLAELGFADTSTCDGLDADPANDPCERAMKRLTAMVLDACSGRVPESCDVDVQPEGCSASTMGELMRENAAAIQSGYCLGATNCSGVVDDGLGLGRRPAKPGRGPRAHPAQGPYRSE